MAETYTYQQPMAGMPANSGIIVRGSDNAFIPLALANRDYQAFLTWIAEGNAAPEGWTGPTNPTAPPEEQTPPPAS